MFKRFVLPLVIGLLLVSNGSAPGSAAASLPLHTTILSVITNAKYVGVKLVWAQHFGDSYGSGAAATTGTATVYVTEHPSPGGYPLNKFIAVRDKAITGYKITQQKNGDLAVTFYFRQGFTGGNPPVTYNEQGISATLEVPVRAVAGAPGAVVNGPWSEVVAIPHGDQAVGEELEGNNLWLLLQTPDTVNHGPEYVGEVVSTTNHRLLQVTPPYLPATPATFVNPVQWGRTSGGQWWVANTSIVNGQTTTATAVWSPGGSAWTELQPLALSITWNGMPFTPTVTVYRGVDGNAWLTSDYDEYGVSGVAQDAVYRLTGQGWQSVYTFPKVPVDNYPTLAIAAPAGPSALLVINNGATPTMLSSIGAIEKTLSLPSGLRGPLQTGLDTVSVSGDGIIYVHGTGTLLAWKGDTVSSLISPGSLLTDGTWAGLWGNAPVMTVYSNNVEAAYAYENGRWTLLPFMVAKTPGYVSSMYLYGVAQWSNGSALWTVSQQGTIYLLRGVKAPM